MRLIDADKLKKYLQNRLKEAEENFAYEESKKIARHTTKLLCEDADAQETVDAIPVEWIEKYIEEMDEIGFCPEAMHVSTMMGRWREEQNNVADKP